MVHQGWDGGQVRSDLNRFMDLFDEVGIPYVVEDDPAPHPDVPGRCRIKVASDYPGHPFAAIVFTATGEYEEVGVWGERT